MVNDTKKYLYCPTCKEYPDNIIEYYNDVKEMRYWDGECYSLEDAEYSEPEPHCAKCKTKLEEKEQ